MIKSLGIFATAATLSMTAMQVSAGGMDVHYKGHQPAKKVCMSIVDDDAMTLKFALKRAAAFSPIPYSKVHNYYSCNDMKLIDFAYSMEAEEVKAYLKRKGEIGSHVEMQELASR